MDTLQHSKNKRRQKQLEKEINNLLERKDQLIKYQKYSKKSPSKDQDFSSSKYYTPMEFSSTTQDQPLDWKEQIKFSIKNDDKSYIKSFNTNDKFIKHCNFM
jgi:hypothetical protein